MGDQQSNNIGTDSPAAKKAEAEARERAEKLDKSVTPESLEQTFEKATNANRPPP